MCGRCAITNLYHSFLCVILSISACRAARACFRSSKLLFIGDSRIRFLKNRFLDYINPNFVPAPKVKKRSAKVDSHLRVSPK